MAIFRGRRKSNQPCVHHVADVIPFSRRRPRQYPSKPTLIAELHSVMPISRLAEQYIDAATAGSADLLCEATIESSLDRLTSPW